MVPDDPLLITWLADRDSQCPLCKYNLRGLVHPRCPECGQELRLSVALAQPFFAAWITAMAASFAGAGFGIFLAFVSMFGGGPPDPLDKACFGYFISMVPGSVVIAAGRRSIQCWSRGAQWMLAVILLVGNFITFVVLMSRA